MVLAVSIKDDEYVLGDDNYITYPFLVPMLIKVEHAFDMLRTCFPRPNIMSVLIRGKLDVIYASGWIRVCIVLNNFLIGRQNDSLTALLEKQYAEKERLERIRLEETYDSSSEDSG
ncbi:hypothetical protein INT47_006501 [Mucor saturninus]|uniref:Uncharacterized protein n=1 Tax=Mucor saturninus TaxID=64648 RepID=A0A8H7QQY0_9FUNG|nr:hypothetical protein INT47_006501 [Mucor saturninus]